MSDDEKSMSDKIKDIMDKVKSDKPKTAEPKKIIRRAGAHASVDGYKPKSAHDSVE